MAHIRERFLKEIIIRTLAFSPIIGILGHRQVGKTTLLSLIANDYFTLDDEDTIQIARSSAKGFIKSIRGLKTAIDECQLVPNLFPALKERVRINKKPGQFILSGSVRFTSRKAIKESLTGRIVNLELLPFAISELQHLPLPNTIFQIIQSKNLSALANRLEPLIEKNRHLNKEIELYFERGGLPGICFIRDNKIRNLKMSEQMATIIDRDLRMVHATSLPYSQILDFVREISINEGEPWRFSHIEQKLRIAEATQKKLLYALEAVFLIRQLPIEGDKKGHVIYMEDQAESSYLAGYRKDKKTQFEGLLFRNIRAQLMYRMGLRYRFFHYLTRGGARVPFGIETDNGYAGILPLEGERPNRSELAMASSFLRSYELSKVIMIALHGKTEVIDNRIILLPATGVV